MDTLVLVVASIAVGLLVGILSGLLGIGGGTLLVPTLRLCYLLDPIACTATSLFTIIPTSISGAVSHLRGRTCIPRLGLAVGLGGAVTSSIGVYLADISPEWLIMVVTACIIVYSAVTMLRKGLSSPRTQSPPADEEVETGGHVDASAFGNSADSLPAFGRLTTGKVVTGVLIGLLAGLGAGYAGVGGGFIIVPLIVQLVDVPMRLAPGTSLVAVMILAIPGVVYQALLGNVHWIAGIALACGSIPGAMVGARLVKRIPERALYFLFGVLLVVIAVFLVINQLNVMGL